MEVEDILKNTPYKESIREFVEMLKVVPIDNTGLEPQEMTALFEGKTNYHTAGIVFQLVGKINPRDISQSYQMYLQMMAKAKRMQMEWNEDANKLITNKTKANERTN